MYYQRQQALIKGPGPVRAYEQSGTSKFDVMVNSNNIQTQPQMRQKTK